MASMSLVAVNDLLRKGFGVRPKDLTRGVSRHRRGDGDWTDGATACLPGDSLRQPETWSQVRFRVLDASSPAEHVAKGEPQIHRSDACNSL